MEGDRDILDIVYSKIDKIMTGAVASRDLAETVRALAKFLSWIRTDRSMLEHRCFFAFLNFLYESYGDDYSAFRHFRDDVLRMVGWCDTHTKDATVKGEKIRFVKYCIRSISWRECSQKDFHRVFEDIQILAQQRWGVDFDAWKAENRIII